MNDDCSKRVEGSKEPTGHTLGVRSVSVVGDDRLASGSDDSTIRIWDFSTCLLLVWLRPLLHVRGVKSVWREQPTKFVSFACLVCIPDAGTKKSCEEGVVVYFHRQRKAGPDAAAAKANQGGSLSVSAAIFAKNFYFVESSFFFGGLVGSLS